MPSGSQVYFIASTNSAQGFRSVGFIGYRVEKIIQAPVFHSMARNPGLGFRVQGEAKKERPDRATEPYCHYQGPLHYAHSPGPY